MSICDLYLFITFYYTLPYLNSISGITSRFQLVPLPNYFWAWTGQNVSCNINSCPCCWLWSASRLNKTQRTDRSISVIPKSHQIYSKISVVLIYDVYVKYLAYIPLNHLTSISRILVFYNHCVLPVESSCTGINSNYSCKSRFDIFLLRNPSMRLK